MPNPRAEPGRLGRCGPSVPSGARPGATPDLEKTCKGDRVDEILLWLEMLVCVVRLVMTKKNGTKIEPLGVLLVENGSHVFVKGST